MKLNLGACDRKINGFISVDICEPADQIADLTKTWPWGDSEVDEIVAYDVLEHLPNKIHTMNELWRVLKPSGKVTIEVPSAAKGAGAFQDPTHCSYWTRNDFQYYAKGKYARERFRNLASYPVKADFKIISVTETQVGDMYDDVYKIAAVLEAVK